MSMWNATREKETSKSILIDKYAQPNYRTLMEVGDWVVVKDGSYMVGLGHDCFELDKPSSGVDYFTPGIRNDIFQIVAVNVDCPTSIRTDKKSLSYKNNCIIKSLVNKDIFFCSIINIVKLKKNEIDTSDLASENVSKAMLRDLKIDSII